MAIPKNSAKIALGVLVALSVGTASAAEPIGTVAQLNGEALISNGSQYVPAREGTKLNEFDRILILDDSSAVLEFNDGCRYNMGQQELLTLSKESACQSAASKDADIFAKASAVVGPQGVNAQSVDAIEKAAIGQLGATSAAGFAGSQGLMILGGLGVGGFAWGASEQHNAGPKRSSPGQPLPPLSPF